MSDYESRREDAKREAWEDAHTVGRCPNCDAPVYGEVAPATLTEPESGRGECSECDGERGRECAALPEEEKERLADMAMEPRYPR